jgi:hypothetical protein
MLYVCLLILLVPLRCVETMTSEASRDNIESRWRILMARTAILDISNARNSAVVNSTEKFTERDRTASIFIDTHLMSWYKRKTQLSVYLFFKMKYVVFPQTKLLYILSPCKHTKNLILILFFILSTSSDCFRYFKAKCYYYYFFI